MKKILMAMSVIGMVAVLMGLAACSNTTTTTKATTQPVTTAANTTAAPTTTAKQADPANITVEIYDIDDEKIGSYSIATTTDGVLLEELQKVTNVVSYQAQWGTSIVSVGGQLTDNNWYCAILENDEYTATGIDGLVIDDGDKFTFKMECWNTVESEYGTMDSYDVLVDKAIYHYAKTYMQDAIKACESFKASEYWTFASINMMISNMYDSNAFTMKNRTDALAAEMGTAVFTELKPAEYGKYYYTAKALGLDLTEFKGYYKEYIEANLSDTYSDYVTPFVVSFANSLEVTSDKITALKEKTITDGYFASTAWGADALGWQFVTMANLSAYSAEILKEKLPVAESGNACTDAIILMAYAAYGESVRTGEVDLIKVMMDTYYDAELGLVKYAAKDEGTNWSTNQIYAGLMAYKAARDSGKAVNILA